MIRLLTFLTMFALCFMPIAAQSTIGLAWDEVPGAEGYRVDYGVDGAGYPALTVEVEQTHAVLGVDEATRYWFCVRTVDADDAPSVSCSESLFGWAAPQISGIAVIEASYDRDLARILLTLRIDGHNFLESGAVHVGDPALAVIDRHWISDRRVDVVLSADPSLRSVADVAVEIFNRDPSDATCNLPGDAPAVPPVRPGQGCSFDAQRVALQIDALVSGLFSTGSNQFTSSGQLYHQTIYAIPEAGQPIERYVPSFLPGNIGLTALQLLDDGRVLFGVSQATTIVQQGVAIQLQPNVIYAVTAAGSVSQALVWQALGLPISGFGALALRPDGALIFVPAANQLVGVGGALVSISRSRVYRFDPADGTLSVVFDGGVRGIGIVDGVDWLDDGRIAISTSGSPFVSTPDGLMRLWDQNVYAFDAGSGRFERWLDGVALGLQNLDAFSLGATVEVALTLLPDPEPPSPVTRFLFSVVTDRFADGMQLFDQNVYAVEHGQGPIVTHLPNFLPGGVGLDGLDVDGDGAILFTVHPAGMVSHAGGLTYLDESRIYRRDPLGTIGVALDLSVAGLPLAGINAFDLLPDGSVLFSPSATQTIDIAGQPTLLRPWRAYRFVPASGALSLEFDGAGLGIGDIDALHRLDDGRIAFSTAGSPFVATPAGLLRLWSMNAYVHDPSTGAIELLFDGGNLGLLDLDAFTIVRPSP